MIDVRDLHFTYAHSNKAACGGWRLPSSAGRSSASSGRAAPGKSTTQKILIGLLEGYGGSVRVRDKEVAAWTADDYERIGVSFEAPNHFLKLTGLENLRYFAALYHGADARARRRCSNRSGSRATATGASASTRRA